MLTVLMTIAQLAVPQITTPDLRNPQPVGAYNVPIARDLLVPPLRVEFAAYRDAIMANPDLDADEKARRIRARFESMRASLQQQRQDAWRAYYYWERAQNGVTKSPNDMTGDTKKSYGECHLPRDRELRTRRAWGTYYRLSGDVSWGQMDRLTAGRWYAANESVVPNAKNICSPNLRRSGGGKELVRVFVYFRYPEAVAVRKATEDTNHVMGQIG